MFRFAAIEANDVNFFKHICFRNIYRKIFFLSIIFNFVRNFDFKFKSSKTLKLEHFYCYDEFLNQCDYFNFRSVDFFENYYFHFAHNCFED